MVDLRPYQIDSVASILAAVDPLVVAPTGSGKTVIIAEAIRQAENKFVLVIAHRREIIKQTRDKLADAGIAAGVILAGEPMNQMARVQVATVQTFHARYIRGGKDLPPVDVIVIDEAHHTAARTYRTILEAYPHAKVIGLTATPCRKDGRGLGSTFKTLIETPQIEQLIELKHLVETKVYAPSAPDLKGVTVRNGDYAEEQLAQLMDHGVLIGGIVTHWHRLNPERRPTVVFASSVAHSIHIAEEFTKSGVKAEHIDGKTDKAERDAILKRLERGDLELVSNCMVLTEGWDAPYVGCCVLARPTKSMGLYRQMAGRVIRPYPGKDHALILDHAGVTLQHGFVEDRVAWTLDADTKAKCPSHESRSSTASSNILACSQCSAIRTAGKPCPECGFQPKRPGEYLHFHDGDLAHLDRDGTTTRPYYTLEERKRFYQGLLYLTLARGQKAGAAAYRFKDKFGAWPDRAWAAEPLPPTPEVAAYDRHCRIRYAKSLEKGVAHG